jgi:hypothetical protein
MPSWELGWLPLAVFGGDQLEHASEFGQGLLSRRHERIAAANGRDFRHPAIRLVPIQDYLVVVKTHPILILRRPTTYLGTTRSTFALSSDLDVVHRRMWFRDWLAHFTHGLEVRGQSVLKVAARLFFVLACRGAAWQAISLLSPRNWGHVTFSSMA